MMKKLLVLCLVFGMASLAQAALSFEIYVNAGLWDGSSAVALGDTIEVVWDDSSPVTGLGALIDEIGFSALQIDVSAGDHLSGVGFTTVGPYSGSPFFASPWSSTVPPVSVITDTGNGVNYKIAGKYAASPFGPATAGDIAWFEFTVNAAAVTAGNIIVDPYLGTYQSSANFAVVGSGDVYPYADIPVIPEPMTIALLGIGGLFLRRRK